MKTKLSKKKAILSVVLVGIILLMTGCGYNAEQIAGAYLYAGPVYRGGVSSYYLEPKPSESYDYLMEQNLGTMYFISERKLMIKQGENERLIKDIKYVSERLTGSFLEKNYAMADTRLKEFFDGFDKCIRYTIYGASGDKLDTEIFLLDRELYIAELRPAGLFYSIDRIVDYCKVE
ncbi:MAG: hypothetical protein R6W99_05805 [Clostridia bacterium]